ncbi:UNVERIFIED_CONTAM: hypothetical protein HDU68_002015, partial [Siphonaria sp. JEL0065]
MRAATRSEISKHNTPDDAWLLIDGKVYDITSFLEAHPGGRRVLLPHLGQDASSIFHNFHATSPVLTKYGKLQVAVVVSNPAKQLEVVASADPVWTQQWASPYYKDSHKRLRAWVRDLVDRELMPYVHEWDTEGKVPISNIALGITEPYAGSDVANIQTTATKIPDGKHSIINGEKKWITTGNWSEYIVIAARTGGKGMNGVSLILLERFTP